RKYFEVHARLLPRDLLNCLLAVLAEMQQQRLHELLIEQVTRAMPVAVRVARNPLPKRHGALHVGRLVLSMSKYLIRLSNTSANDHQRVRGQERKRGFGCFGNVRLEVGDEWVCQCAGKAFTGQSCRGRWFDTLTDWSSSATAFRPWAPPVLHFGSDLLSASPVACRFARCGHHSSLRRGQRTSWPGF